MLLETSLAYTQAEVKRQLHSQAERSLRKACMLPAMKSCGDERESKCIIAAVQHPSADLNHTRKIDWPDMELTDKFCIHRYVRVYYKITQQAVVAGALVGGSDKP